MVWSMHKRFRIHKLTHLALGLITGFMALPPSASATRPPLSCHEGRLSGTVDALLCRSSQDRDPMPTDGTYAGQFAENSKNRTLVLLTIEEKSLFGLPPEALAFANYRHQGRFYVAYLPGLKISSDLLALTADPVVREVRVIEEHWAALTNPALAEMESHIYLHFRFRPGHGVRLLYDQASHRPPTPPRQAASIDDVVFSIEAVRPQSAPNADFIPAALKNDFAIAPLFYSKWDRDWAESADTGRVNTDQMLDLRGTISKVSGIARPEEALLFTAIHRSHALGRMQTYNFVMNNCTNGLFDLLDSTLISQWGFDRGAFVENLRRLISFSVAKQFSNLKKVADSHHIELPSSEFSELSEMSAHEVAEAMTRGALSSPAPERYLTWLPPLAYPHLAARGLLSNPLSVSK